MAKPRRSAVVSDEAPRLTPHAIRNLGLPPSATQALLEIQEDLADAYREDFIALRQAVSAQASALNRIQTTLAILVEALAPQLAAARDRIPAAIRVACAGEAPDVASALVVADPIGAGYTLSQGEFAKACGVTESDMSAVIKALGLRKEADCVVTVRAGNNRNTRYNYHPRAVKRFHDLLEAPPEIKDGNQRSAVRRIRKKLRRSRGKPGS